MCLACLSMSSATSHDAVTRREILGRMCGAGAAAWALTTFTPGRAIGQGAATPTAAALDRYRDHLLPASDATPGSGAVRVTFLGTTTLLFDDGETQLMIDGFFTRPSLAAIAAGPIATDPAVVDAALDRAGVNQLSALFVAHSHWDHALDAAYVAVTTGAQLYGSASTLNIGRGGGLTEEQMTLYAPGQPVPIGAFSLTVLPSKHSPPTPAVNDDVGLTIDAPLAQPAPATAYVEGGSFDFLIAHGDDVILVKPSANYVAGALDGVRADVLFLATATLGNQDQMFRDAFYAESVAAVQPRLVVPIHWDDFLAPLSDQLAPLDNHDLTTGWDFLLERVSADEIEFGFMQGYQSIELFGE